ncbi:MAG: EAL domain-containing protein [Firmicutes bacterium]|nr:EAL domain-containing protein [Alicyclobacillaceae bacterium]MCL6497759.1 EAL domain-containing protein [Bacillota bacterium]
MRHIAGTRSGRGRTGVEAPGPEGLSLRLAHLVEVAPAERVAAVLTDARGLVSWLNPGFSRLTGWTLESLRQRTLAEALGLDPDQAAADQLAQAMAQRLPFSVRLAARRRTREPYWAEVLGFPQGGEGRFRGFAVLVSDRTGEWRAVRRDPLTGLLDRLALQAYLPLAIQRSQESGRRVVVGLLDLDGFRAINERFGHAAGDAVLRAVGQRLRRALQSTDLAIRLGGDQFALVLEEPPQGLEAYLQQMGEVLQEPVAIAEGPPVVPAVSLGLTAVPPDAPDLDGLLRHADLARQTVKLQGESRLHWWYWWAHDQEGGAPRPPTPLFAAYGPKAAGLLKEALAELESAWAEPVDPEGARARLGPELLARLEEHFRTALDPARTPDRHRREAQSLGTLMALKGVDGPTLTQAWIQWYHSAVSRTLFLPWRADRKMQLLQVVTERVTSALQAALEAHGEVVGKYQHAISAVRHLKDRYALWPDLVQAVFRRLLSLPGIVAAVVARPDADGRFVYEFHTFQFEVFLQEYQRRRGRPYPPATTAHRSHVLVRAWTTGRLAVRHDVVRDARSPAAREALAAAGLHTVMAVPVGDRDGHPVAILAVWGAYPGMFATQEVRNFGIALGSFLGEAWNRQAQYPAALPTDQSDRVRYRQLLYGGQVVFLVQPVVALSDGRLVKVEVLARLVDGEREVPPGRFLPALGYYELERLFVQGLQFGLTEAQAWQARGEPVKVGVNLPGPVLLHPNCPEWVNQALAATGADPRALELELLESDPADVALHRKAMERLGAMGVSFSMDDLGAGYNGLHRLRQLPFQAAKVDWSLVREVSNTPEKTVAFLGALVRLLHDLGLAVVMEGLETPDLVEMAVELGADFGQGYAIARPMAPAALAAWNQGRAWPVRPGRPETALGRLALAWRQSTARLDPADPLRGGAGL